MMEPTGYDTVLFSFADPVRVLRRVVDALHERSGGVVEFDLDFLPNDEPALTGPGRDELLGALSEREWRHCIVCIYQKPWMRQHLEDHVYTSGPEGDGPLALHVRRRCNASFELGLIREVSREESPVGPPLPYSGWLCSPLVYEWTVVTWESPERSRTCNGFVDLLIQGCRYG
ncbi:MAG TPA: hypothetical protein VFT74_09030 [Isosphaeraceae bacterium]|nr:hypothetical protein [Isosphaeraceae bacterium]